MADTHDAPSDTIDRADPDSIAIVRRAPRPLLDTHTVDALGRAIQGAGLAGEGYALIADAARHARFLARCGREADAVLAGDRDAAARLWLLLREPLPDAPRVPPSVVAAVAGPPDQPPRTFDGDTIVRLVAGVVRAANTPTEAEQMLDALEVALRPLMTLELAWRAAAHVDDLERSHLATVLTARFARDWRLATGEGVPVRDQAGPERPVLDVDRAAYEADSWRDTVVTSELRYWDLLWTCPGHTQLSMSQIDRFGPRYTIESLSNDGTCPGQTLTIRGRDFGAEGRVYFPVPAPTDPAFDLGGPGSGKLAGVQAVSWTDTEIQVVVPPWATIGDLHLNAFTRHRSLCSVVDVYRLGNSILFQGGLAGVHTVSIAGQPLDPDSKTPVNLDPGDSVALTWRASAGPAVRVRAQLIDGATVLWEQSGLSGGLGGTVLTVPDPGEPRLVQLVLTASGPCGATQPWRRTVSLSVKPALSITFIEVTQGVQEDLAGVLAGRGVPTIAWKDTAVRVHLFADRKGWWSNRLARITGSLTIDGRRLSPTNVRTMVPADRGFAAVKGLSQPDFTNDTLNFLIPAAWLAPGPHTLTVRVTCDDQSGHIDVGQTITWGWLDHAPLQVRGVYMALYGSDAGILDYVRRVLDFLPTSHAGVGVAGPQWLTHRYDLKDREGWEDLLDDLEDEWDDYDEDSGVRWLGIVSASERYSDNIRSTQGIAGTPGIAALAMADRPDVGAHELAHTYGLRHVNLPMGGPDGPYDSADNGGSLRRPPFDVRTGKAVALPAGDLMSYLEPVRPGISTWTRMIQRT